MADSSRSALVASQCELLLSSATRPAVWHKEQLEAVEVLFTDDHDELCDAMWKDLRRNVSDAYLIDVAYCAEEAEYPLRHLDTWMKPTHKPMPAVCGPAHIVVLRDPLAVTLIIGARKESTMLTFAPLAAGNMALLKSSEISAASAARECGALI
jgi:aldehyde dehydrogenase (NAD+)